MTRRKSGKVLPFPKGASTKPIATIDLKDHEKLIFRQFIGPQDAVIAQANAAAQAFVELMMEVAKLSSEQGWVLNRHKMRWEQYPVTGE